MPTALVTALVVVACAPGSGGEAESPIQWTDEPGVVEGTVSLLSFGPGGGSEPAPVHRSSWVNGRSYSGMEDNDLRGFLDGRFKYAWNQPGQVHVRVGRRHEAPRWGELELFRVVQKWDGISLPPGSEVVDASLTLSVEESPDRPVRMMLYSVRPEFDPGQGGTLQNNVSPPVAGEVWWNDAGFEAMAWALPGAGFADDGPGGDTPALPMARALWVPGDERIVLASDALAAYIQSMATTGQSLRFLLRLSDLHEDTPGTAITLYSGSTGDSWEVSRRPRLELRWRGPRPSRSWVAPVLLEYGRTYELPRLETGGGVVSVDFAAAESSLTPTLQVRGGRGVDVDAWRAVTSPLVHDWTWVEARVVAALDPLPLGSTFEAVIEDTWIRTAAPEDQVVPVVFHSPVGVLDTVWAEYQGDSAWRVRYEPRVLGPWTFQWTQNFTEIPHTSALGRIDVVAGDRVVLREALATLRTELEAGEPTQADVNRAMVRFMRLERALIRDLGPAAYRSPEGTEVRIELDAVRALLGEDPVPETLEMVPDRPPTWAR